MRRMIALAAALSIAGCHSRPSVDKIKADATARVQHQLDSDFGKGKATVSAVDLVETTAPYYEGSAHIAVGGKVVDLPLKVTFDGTTTIVDDDDARIGTALEAADAAMAASLDGKYSDYIFSPALFSRLPAQLRGQRAKLNERLQTVSPVIHEDGGYFGSGCMPHSCTTDAAAWFMTDDGKHASAIILETDEPTAEGLAAGITASPNFQIFGASLAELPSPLRSWATDLGMTNMNIGGGPEYTPPAPH